MDRKNLMIASSLTGILVLAITAIIIIPAIKDTSTASSNPIRDNGNNSIDPAEEYLTFNNSTPKAAAISIARLNEGAAGFGEGNGITTNASLTPDKKYWIVNMHEDGYDDWIVPLMQKL